MESNMKSLKPIPPQKLPKLTITKKALTITRKMPIVAPNRKGNYA